MDFPYYCTKTINSIVCFGAMKHQNGALSWCNYQIHRILNDYIDFLRKYASSFYSKFARKITPV